MQDFIDKVLPTAKEVEAYVENKHEKNFVSMIAPVNPNSKPMFKWGNRLSWAYTGNITDSDMKQKVKAAGGNVEDSLFSGTKTDEITVILMHIVSSQTRIIFILAIVENHVHLR